jgi:hypothetical protein
MVILFLRQPAYLIGKGQCFAKLEKRNTRSRRWILLARLPPTRNLRLVGLDLCPQARLPPGKDTLLIPEHLTLTQFGDRAQKA